MPLPVDEGLHFFGPDLCRLKNCSNSNKVTTSAARTMTWRSNSSTQPVRSRVIWISTDVPGLILHRPCCLPHSSHPRLLPGSQTHPPPSLRVFAHAAPCPGALPLPPLGPTYPLAGSNVPAPFARPTEASLDPRGWLGPPTTRLQKLSVSSASGCPLSWHCPGAFGSRTDRNRTRTRISHLPTGNESCVRHCLTHGVMDESCGLSPAIWRPRKASGVVSP